MGLKYKRGVELVRSYKRVNFYLVMESTVIMLYVYRAVIKLNLQREPLFFFVKGWLYLACLGTFISRDTGLEFAALRSFP